MAGAQMTAPIATTRTCQHEFQVRKNGIYMTELCMMPRVEGSGFCFDHSAQCRVCLEHFGCSDPSDPDNQQCPDCAADY